MPGLNKEALNKVLDEVDKNPSRYTFRLTGFQNRQLPPREWSTWNVAVQDFNGRWGYTSLWLVDAVKAKRKLLVRK